jgi:hypothetical protein
MLNEYSGAGYLYSVLQMVLPVVKFYAADCFDAELNRHALVIGGWATLLTTTFCSSACYNGSEL